MTSFLLKFFREHHLPRFNVDRNLKSVHCSQQRMKLFCTCSCNIMIRCRFLAAQGITFFASIECYCERGLFLIKQETFKKQSFAISIKLIEAILMPKVLYACETWTKLTKKQIKDLEKLQKDAVTIINSLLQSMPYDGIVLECGLMPMEF